MESGKRLKILLSAKGKMEFYVDAVKACGGEADALYCPKYSDEYDGLILCGGNDIHPERMCCSKKRADTVDGSKVFEHFLSLCRGKR